PEVLWALRGGQPNLGVVTSATVRLAELPVLYGGSVFFAEEHIETVLRTWIAWTATADPRVSTSAAVVRFPPLDMFPPPLRGRRLLTLRFAYPGSASAGASLAEPLLSAAPIHLGGLREMPPSEIPSIHNDPAVPGPSWTTGLL